MSVAGFGLAYGTMNGTVQNHIGFAGELNEIGFTIFAGMIGVLGIFSIDYNKILKALI